MKEEKELENIICLHQFIRPTIYVPIEGVGNCMICKRDEYNKYCKQYTPIGIGYYEVNKK